jgi:ribosomal-protein-alanine N-acetyltransferase
LTDFEFRPLDRACACEIVRWRYDPPYDFYNSVSDDDAALAAMLDPENDYRSVWRYGSFVGFCSFGPDARVAGGDYTPAALDVGAGLRPELAGHSLGRSFLAAIVAAAVERAGGLPLRATIAAFNMRALRVVGDAGFAQTARFRRDDDVEFVVLLRPPNAAEN